MNEFSEDGAKDLAENWVKKLRSRFSQLGLSSYNDSDHNYFPSNNSELPTSSQTLPSGYQSKIKQSLVRDIGSNCSKNFTEFWPSDDAFHRNSGIGSKLEPMPSTSLGNSLLDLQQLRQRRLAYFNTNPSKETRNTESSAKSFENEGNTKDMFGLSNYCNSSKHPVFYTRPKGDSSGKSIHDGKVALKNSPKKLENEENSKLAFEVQRCNSSLSSERSEFYTRPKSASSISDWGKHDWERTRMESFQSDDDDEYSPQARSTNDNVDLMLDWWGLRDMPETSELAKYLPKYTSKSIAEVTSTDHSISPSKKINEENTNVGGFLNKNAEDNYDIFPVGFDETELEQNKFQNGVRQVYYSSDSDSDYTQDDPVSKPKSPKAIGEYFLARSPRTLVSPRGVILQKSFKSRFSPSPPMPQITGSLYHEFASQDTNTTDKISDINTGVLDDDLLLETRKRSLSQPNIPNESLYSCYPYQTTDSNMAGRKTAEDNKTEKKYLIEIDGNDKIRPYKKDKVNDIKFDKFRVNHECTSELSMCNVTQDNKPNVSEKNKHLIKVCKDCGYNSDSSLNWCTECGTALERAIKPDKAIDITAKQQPKESGLQDKSKTTTNETAVANQNIKPRKNGNGRRWEKSSTAWSSYKNSHLSKPPATKSSKTKSKKFGEGDRVDRPRSSSCKGNVKKDNGSNDVVGSWPKSSKMNEIRSKTKNCGKQNLKLKGNNATENLSYKKEHLAIDLSDLKIDDDYNDTTKRTQNKRWEALPYFCLPDEIIMKIVGYLSNFDLAICSQVCKQLYRICQDEDLWKTIVIKKRNISDETLVNIGSKKPVNLSLIHCRGDHVTSIGLRELFRKCGDNLEELNFSCCNGGQLIGESILLHVALRCSKLRSVDASWSNVGDNGIEALVQNVERLECICLNGCQAITDRSLKVIADKHGDSLRTFETFGCFNVSAGAIKQLGTKCPNLQTLSLGQCYKITSSAIGHLVSHLKSIVNLDLRGCKQAKDACVKTIAKHCPLLVNLVLANCPLISDVAMTEIAQHLPSVRFLDVCGCFKVTDHGVKALAQSCNRLNYLDLSCTSITQKSVIVLANYCSQNLKSLKLSFCVNVTDDSVTRLVKHCKKMTTLHLYGCKRLKNVEALQKFNQFLKLEF